jgi:hypothetical protein
MYEGTTVQPGNCDASTNCFVTGLAAGTAVGSFDIDGGQTSIQSPAITLPAGASISLSFRFFLGHLNTSSGQDYFRVRVVAANGQVQTVYARGGTASNVAGTWSGRTVSLSAWAGQTIRLRFDAADAGSGSVVEAGFDNVVVRRQ